MPDKPLENSVKKILEEYSFPNLVKIYEKQVPVPYLASRTQKFFHVLAWISAGIAVLLFFLSQFYLSIIPIAILLYCIHKISKIKHYEEGLHDGLNSGFEYGAIHADLELLLLDDPQNHYYSRLLYNLYNKTGWDPEPKQTDHFKLKKFLSNKFTDTL